MTLYIAFLASNPPQLVYPHASGHPVQWTINHHGTLYLGVEYDPSQLTPEHEAEITAAFVGPLDNIAFSEWLMTGPPLVFAELKYEQLLALQQAISAKFADIGAFMQWLQPSLTNLPNL